MKEITKIVLKSGKDDAVLRQHPWVFSGAIKKIYGPTQEGDIVEVFNNKDRFLGMGHWGNGSIAVRIFSFEQIELDEDFWKRKLQIAYDVRKSLNLIDNPKTNVYRLVFAEGDGMPGLVIDVYNKTAVIQAHSVGMYLLKDDIAQALQAIYKDGLDTIYVKSKESLPKNLPFNVENHFIIGNKESDVVFENGNKFEVNWVKGQKTGFFIDQRFNRELVGQYSKGKKVLNTYCYTGGFSIYALHGDAKEVHSVDSSKIAIELTDENVTLNGFTGDKHKSFAIDTMSFLNEMEDPYDLIILDPPAFAKHRDVRHKAVQGYKRINATAFRKIAPGGILFTFSCSQVVDRRLFESTVLAAAIQSGRKVRVLHHLSQPADHPVSIFHPEGEYLKGMVLFVE
jgi:23S rRNA (cytosine1962-C5)-methyltransferase